MLVIVGIIVIAPKLIVLKLVIMNGNAHCANEMRYDWNNVCLKWTLTFSLMRCTSS